MNTSLSLTELQQSAIRAAGQPIHGTADAPLRIAMANGLIASATFAPSGEPQTDAWRELYCQTIEGLPAEEAAAHGASYVLYGLLQGRRLADCPGIVTPAVLAPVLADIEQALRARRPSWRSRAGMAPLETAAFLAVPANWRELTGDERLNRLRTALAEAVGKGALPDLGLKVERLEDDIRGRPVRITLTYAKAADTAQLPGAMRAIEGLLRREVAPWLEIYAEERQDHNKLRRTILIDQRPASD
ncbi:MAG: hypothetical protein ACM3X0_04605 [Bacteroidota bacterium]